LGFGVGAGSGGGAGVGSDGGIFFKLLIKFLIC
jgi:hypothetical protein